MSLLPQRKKSAEEIAQLRESLGITTSPPDFVEPGPSGQQAERIAPSRQMPVPEPVEPAVHLSPDPQPAARARLHGSHSLKRSERTPAMEEATPGLSPVPVDPVPADPVLAETASSEPRKTRRVRSLRKSEQAPVLPPDPAKYGASANAPFHRHSEEELAEIRRRAALAQLSAPPPPSITHASPILSAAGYLSAAAAAAGIWFYRIPLAAAASCLGVAVLVAALIYLRNPYSRHHAAFITIAALFIAAFGALQYFPQLTFKHGP